MHDWTLKKVNFEWELARVVLELNDSVSAVRKLVADGVTELSVPRKNAWGPSVSVNEVHEIEELPSMQISSFQFPTSPDFLPTTIRSLC